MAGGVVRDGWRVRVPRHLSRRTAPRAALPGSVARISGGAVVARRVAALLLAVRAQAFEQTPERRLVPRQAGCPVGVSSSSELIDVGLRAGAFVGSITEAERHFSTPKSGARIVQRAGRMIQASQG